MQVTLRSTDDFIITYHQANEGRSESVVITFGQINSGLNDSGFGTQFFKKQGIDSIYVGQRGKSFYQGLSGEALVDAVSSVTKGRKVFTYGSSLGGYAALYYALYLDCPAISFSPRCSVDPAIADVIDRKYREPFAHIPLEEVAQSRTKQPSFVAYDPEVQIDQAYVERRVEKAFPQANLIKVHNGLHGVGRAMSYSGVLKQFILSIIHTGEAISFEIDPLMDPRYTGEQALKEYNAGNIKEAQDFAERSLRIGGDENSVFVISRLCERRLTTINPRNYKLDPTIRRYFLRQHAKKSSKLNSEIELTLNLIDAKCRILNFEAAHDLAYFLSVKHPDDETVKSKLSRVRKIIRHLEALS
ncbi:hypothetical protein [Pseudomonas sp. CM27]|uniref:hypothetical protein n=1 Tax=Pseudomonas sp. CM27 TaxID=2738452 RepID=UPI001555A1E5|nr:hypothetical protein [Pseudomonas sp. CM27]NQD74107.1 hypothetical protein [Pseudomonas sp. CM27]